MKLAPTQQQKSRESIAVNHPDYTANAARWERCRDACSGSDAIKEKGPLYLPPLSTHKDNADGAEAYEAYKKRALWYNASKRTRLGLTGSVTMREPTITFSSPDAEKVLKSAAQLRQELVAEQLEVGRAVLLVNQLPDEDPSISLWWAESVVNWRFERKNGRHRLSMLVLEDEEQQVGEGAEDGGDEELFRHDVVNVRHAYRLKNGRCEYAKWQQNKKTNSAPQSEAKAWESAIPWRPLAPTGKEQLDHIPAIVVGATEIDSPVVEEPLLLDVVDVNISHYQNSADLEHGRHWCALPTALAAGFPRVDDQGQPVEFIVGAQSAWISDNPSAHASYLEFSGAGLGHIAEGMQSKQNMMAVMGGRLLEEAKPSVESAETIKTRLSGEESVIARVGSCAGAALTWAAQEVLIFKLVGYEREESKDCLKLDPMTPKLSSGDIAALMSALQGGGISWQTFFEKMKAGGIVPQNRTMEEEAQLITAGPPAPAPVADGDPNAGDGQDQQDSNAAPDDENPVEDAAPDEEDDVAEAAKDKKKPAFFGGKK